MNFRSSKPIPVAGKTEMRPSGSQQNLDQKVDSVDENLKFKLPNERAEEKPSSSGTRPKEGSAFLSFYFINYFLLFMVRFKFIRNQYH